MPRFCGQCSSAVRFFRKHCPPLCIAPCALHVQAMSRLVVGLRVDRSLHVSQSRACSSGSTCPCMYLSHTLAPQGRHVLACISVIRLLLHGRRDVNQHRAHVRAIPQKKINCFLIRKRGAGPTYRSCCGLARDCDLEVTVFLIKPTWFVEFENICLQITGRAQ